MAGSGLLQSSVICDINMYLRLMYLLEATEKMSNRRPIPRNFHHYTGSSSPSKDDFDQNTISRRIAAFLFEFRTLLDVLGGFIYLPQTTDKMFVFPLPSPLPLPQYESI